eukprot:1819901-Prymnesium_polylepis.1
MHGTMVPSCRCGLRAETRSASGRWRLAVRRASARGSWSRAYTAVEHQFGKNTTPTNFCKLERLAPSKATSTSATAA